MKRKAQSFTRTLSNAGAQPFTHTITVLPPGADPKEFMRHVMAECPDCQAGLARGETPMLGTGEDLMRIARDYEKEHLTGDREHESRQMRRARERQLARLRRRR